MKAIKTLKFCIIILSFISLLFYYATAAVSPGRNPDGYTIIGRVKTEGLGGKGHGFPSKTANIKVVLNGGETISFIRPDGYFSFYGVPAGTHLIEVVAMGYFFSPVRIDVSARLHGKVQAMQTENRRLLTELVLEPLREDYYYERDDKRIEEGTKKKCAEKKSSEEFRQRWIDKGEHKLTEEKAEMTSLRWRWMVQGAQRLAKDQRKRYIWRRWLVCGGLNLTKMREIV
ncbi:hypothetical protein KI387_009039 [Taxus chinensis]|uniref:ER membrane protein complex subunit 7 beta-sandwich domain-containing protein n=1 Tax=Taxus chinensis TaxID=29808 RepID=A0AA38CPT1_TAXCH|nr:hypothetical protein KI387_009039 [Taxus chinensis]